MAHLPRIPRRPDDWSELDLMAYNIEVVDSNAREFFGVSDLPAPSVSETILSNVRAPSGPLSREERLFFRFLQLTNAPAESAVVEFAAMLLGLCNYDRDGEWYIRLNKELQILMGGRHVDANAALAVFTGGHECKLVVRVDKRVGELSPKAQIVADSIAAFQANCRRQATLGRAPKESQVIAGITVVGSVLYFYRTVATQSILDSLNTSTFPSEKTAVLRYQPDVCDIFRYGTDGMRTLDNRRAVFQALQAFRAMIESDMTGA